MDTTIPHQGKDPQANKEADPHVDLNQTPEVKANQENFVIDVAEATMTKMIAISRTKTATIVANQATSGQYVVQQKLDQIKIPIQAQGKQTQSVVPWEHYLQNHLTLS